MVLFDHLQVTLWEHKTISLQESLSTAQTAVARSQKESTASSVAAISQQQLLLQLQDAGAALSDSHGSAQKLHQQLQESQQVNAALQQQLDGEKITSVFQKSVKF